MENVLRLNLKPDEKEAVLELLSKSFPLNYYDGHKHFRFVLDNMPGIKFLLTKNSTNQIVGVLCLIEREFNYFGISMKLTGLSFMATNPSHRDFSVTNHLKEMMFEYIAKNAHLSMGFARKVMDGYWSPYGYLGFTNFGQISVDTIFLSHIKSDIRIARMETIHLPRVHELFELTHLEVLGPLKRNVSLWTYYLKKAEKEHISAEVFWKDGRMIGYVLRKKNVIYEVGCDEGYAQDLLSLLQCRINEYITDEEIHFQIGYRHPLVRYLFEFSHKQTSRYAWNGGHIVRITSLFDFLQKIQPVLEMRLRNSLIKDFSIDCGDFNFEFNNSNLSISQNKSDKNIINLSLHDWQKIIFGIIPADNLVNLSEPRCKDIFNILFPVVCPQVPFIDEF